MRECSASSPAKSPSRECDASGVDGQSAMPLFLRKPEPRVHCTRCERSECAASAYERAEPGSAVPQLSLAEPCVF